MLRDQNIGRYDTLGAVSATNRCLALFLRTKTRLRCEHRSDYFASGAVIVIPVFENHKQWLIFSNKTVSCEDGQPPPWWQPKEGSVQQQMRELRLINEQ